MALSVKGRTAIITGAGSGTSVYRLSHHYCRPYTHACSGINFAFAKLLLEGGCNVLIADLTLRPEAKALVETYSTGSPQAIFQETDVRDWLQLERMFEVAEKELGEIDIVCPGAGVYEPVSVT